MSSNDMISLPPSPPSGGLTAAVSTVVSKANLTGAGSADVQWPSPVSAAAAGNLMLWQQLASLSKYYHSAICSIFRV